MTSFNTIIRRRSNSADLRRHKHGIVVPFAVRRLARLFGLPIATAIIMAEAAGLGERGR